MTRIELHAVKRTRSNGTTYRVWTKRWFGTDGKRYNETIRDGNGDAGIVGKMSKRDAMAVVRKAQSEMDEGNAPVDKPDKMTLAAFKVFHAEIARGELSAGSLRQCDHAFAWALKVIPGDTKLTTITKAHVAKIRTTLKDAGCKPPTIQKTLAYLRAAFNRAIDHNLLVKGANPFSGFKAVSGATKAKESVIRTREEIRQLKAAAPDAWWRAALGLWFTGLRRDEALSLQWDAVDLDGGTVTIRASEAGTFKADDAEYPILAWTAKTANSYRVVPIAADTVAALRQLRESSDGSAYVFLSLERLTAIQRQQEASKWTADSVLVNNVTRDFKRLQKRVLGKDAPQATLHDCRKSFITNALAAGVMPQEVAKYAGDTVEVVMRFYAKARPGADDLVRAMTDDGPALKLAG